MLEKMGSKARLASHKIALASTKQKNSVLLKMANGLWNSRKEIITANRIDINKGIAAGLSSAMLDRLTLTESRISGIADDLRNVVTLNDPIGEVFDKRILQNGLHIHKQRVPIGVLAVIYESRPNVTIDIAGLALKTGNAVILRGGSETINSNLALIKIIHQAIQANDLPIHAVQFIDDPDRTLVVELLKMHNHIDMLIPRGGAALHKLCRENSLIPVITGGMGICHLFVDETADLEAALKVIRNAKVQRPTVCNALDTLLVHKSIANDFIPRLVDFLAKDGVTFRLHESTQNILSTKYSGYIQPAKAGDFDIEWLSLVLGLKVVDSITEAIEHIAVHSTFHSDGILTRSNDNANRFTTEVDSAAVYVNASTRFTDGGQFGLGAEVAISTQRLHARGPMGLRELTTYKWVIVGNNHIRD